MIAGEVSEEDGCALEDVQGALSDAAEVLAQEEAWLVNEAGGY